MKLELAQYRELAAFAQFGSDLDKATQAQLASRPAPDEMLKQNQFSPLPFSKQILIIFAGTSGSSTTCRSSNVREFEKGLYEYVDTANPGLLRAIMEKKILDDELKARHDQDRARSTRSSFARRACGCGKGERVTCHGKRSRLRRRIRSVINTRQITKAMKMVSAASCAARRSVPWRRVRMRRC